MLRLAKALPFFNGPPEDSLAQSFIVSTNGFSISVPTRHGLDNYHGPGTVFQGQLNLQLAKPIKGPCRLRVIFSCLHTIHSVDTQAPSSQPSSSSSSAEIRLSSESSKGGLQAGLHPHSLFEIDHVFVQNEPLQVKRHTFMFNIKFPKVNLPASMTDGDRSVIYALHGELTFQTTPDDASTQSILSSPAVHLKYLPLVPTSIPQYPVIEMAQVMDPYSSRQLFKAAVDSPQRGVCPGESLPLSLTITNGSETDLHSIHLTLVRLITYPSAPSTPTSPSSPTPATMALVALEPTTVHSITIPVSRTSNKNSTWMESIQFNVPTNLGLIPTTNKVITPLFKVDYFLSVSLPVANRGTGLASWFTPAVKNPPPVDISLIRSAAGTGTTTDNDTPSTSRAGSRKNSVDNFIRTNLHMDRITTLNSTMKWPTLIQLPLIPIIVGTVPFSVTERQLRWPIPNYLDVADRPCFVRDRFEEEMMQHLESLETLIVEEEDEEDIENMMQAARKSASSGESDEDEQRARSKIPARFRNAESQSRRRNSQSSSGLDTPPPSPPSSSPMTNGNRSRTNTLPMVSRRSMSPKSGGLGKELLLEMHHSKVQQSIHAGLQDTESSLKSISL
ncbi:hypothetical protein BGZ65_008552 [Modicella reniformis]|uniref:Arrestin C-terminal-like domain-containing protein n=1 Tax=Modicella reniformis TaxID=1440133 RepID=A0A9P6MES1_9FUNG|nr:hypothetical protein BGZ65_008552 [Modicella reniformis]